MGRQNRGSRNAPAATQPPPVFDCEKTISELAGEVDWLFRMWAVYDSLYLTDAHLDLAMRSARQVFDLQRRALAGVIKMNVAKCLAYKGSRGKHVVSLDLAIHSLPDTVDQTERERLAARFEQVRKDNASIIAERDRSIAHNDYAISIGNEPLDNTGALAVEVGIREVGELLNEIAFAFNKGSYLFGHQTTESDEVERLCDILKRGLPEVERGEE